MPTKLPARLISQSQTAPFVFLGRVQAVNENNLQGIAPTESHALVKVEQVLVAPANLGDLRGRVLTVVVKKAAATGSRYMWWATSWVYDRQIGVIEIERGLATLVSAAGDVIDARLRGLDDRVMARIAGAPLIVAGTVTEVQELGIDGIAEGTTWRRARVRVGTVVKGEGAAEVIIQFPGKGSPRWQGAPRLVEGEEGVWILRRPSQEPRMRKVKAEGAWCALDPDDAHGRSGQARIESLARMVEARGRRR